MAQIKAIQKKKKLRQFNILGKVLCDLLSDFQTN